MDTIKDNIKLKGKYFIKGTITTVTGLFIGGTNEGLSVGGADLVVVRDVLTNEPYIPGSSLKGKLRCLYEKATGANLVAVVGKNETRDKQVCIHVCTKKSEYDKCNICKIFGIGVGMGGEEQIIPQPGRLIVRDAFLNDEIANVLKNSPHTDMPYTELKTEVVIDRITSKATPRQLERVPAGSEFEFEMVFNVYEEADHDMLKEVFFAMLLLENDYLGGQGSRGSGKIRFGKFKRNKSGDGISNVDFTTLEEGIKLEWKSVESYKGEQEENNEKVKKLSQNNLTVEEIYNELNKNSKNTTPQQ
jgi:CRISPR-associated protein Csm3